MFCFCKSVYGGRSVLRFCTPGISGLTAKHPLTIIIIDPDRSEFFDGKAEATTHKNVVITGRQTKNNGQRRGPRPAIINHISVS